MSVGERPVASPRHRSRCAVRVVPGRLHRRAFLPQGLPETPKLARGYLLVGFDASPDQAGEQALALVQRAVVAVGEPFGQGLGLAVR